MIEVTAAIIKRDNKILISQRAQKDHLAGLWEFPGGKIELGETPEGCLRREIFEELSIDIEVGDFYAESVYEYPNKKIRLLAFWAEWVHGEIHAQVHDAVKWISIDDLGKFTFAPADIPIVDKLRSEEFV